MPTYDALPDKPAFEDSRSVIYNELRHNRYDMEEVVEKAMRGNVNCQEWLGYDINRRAARIIPEGYVWNARHQVLVPPGFAYCTGCKQLHPISAFGTDERSTGRGKTRSQCRAWETKERTARNRHRTYRKWKRG